MKLNRRQLIGGAAVGAVDLHIFHKKTLLNQKTVKSERASAAPPGRHVRRS